MPPIPLQQKRDIYFHMQIQFLSYSILINSTRYPFLSGPLFLNRNELVNFKFICRLNELATNTLQTPNTGEASLSYNQPTQEFWILWSRCAWFFIPISLPGINRTATRMAPLQSVDRCSQQHAENEQDIPTHVGVWWIVATCGWPCVIMILLL